MKFQLAIAVGVCFLYCTLQGVLPSCMVNPRNNFEKTVTGRYVPYCENFGFKYRNGTIKFADHCFQCGCNGCCGYGYYGGKMHVEGCEVIPDGCDALVVKKVGGRMVECFSEKPLIHVDPSLRK